MKKIKKSNYKSGSNHLQQTKDKTIVNIGFSINMSLSADSSENAMACSKTEQNFLYNLWLTLELLQDVIANQNSKEYQLLEIINPILFDKWIQTGGR